MRIDMHSAGKEILACTITLSRRNLLALLAKLDQEGSACTISSGNVYDFMGNEAHGYVSVKAEENDPHYAREGREPGPMHPDTEAMITDE